jgi:hypothetical protein
MFFLCPFWPSHDITDGPKEPVDRGTSEGIRAIKSRQKKRYFYFKNRFVSFFLFAFSTLSSRHHNTIYRYTKHLKKKRAYF